MKVFVSHLASGTRRSARRAFTLIELMVVVLILALLFMMFLPSLQTVVERSRVSTCSSILRNIGTAYAQYISENHSYVGPYCFTDQRAYDMLKEMVWTDANGNVYDYSYQSCYDHHNYLAPYLGLGNCMPLDSKGSINSDRWWRAKYSWFKEFRCPSTNWQGTSATPYGWSITGSYMQYAGWASQPQTIGSEWPVRIAYVPKFWDASKAVLLFEQWTCNGMTTDASARALPYSTHFKMAAKGPVGMVRNILYIDQHITARQCLDGPEKYSGGGWSCGGTFVPGTSIVRGNEGGMTWTWGGGVYTAWGPILPNDG